MTLDRDIKLQIDLAGYQLLVQANRLNCDNAFAREAHDNAIATLRNQRELARSRAQIKRALRLETDGASRTGWPSSSISSSTSITLRSPMTLCHG